MKVSKFKRWLTVARRPLGAGEWSKTIVVTGLPVFQIKKIPNKYRDDHHINKYATYEVEKRKPECGDSKTKNFLSNTIFTEVTLLNIFSFFCRPWKVIVGYNINYLFFQGTWVFVLKVHQLQRMPYCNLHKILKIELHMYIFSRLRQEPSFFCLFSWTWKIILFLSEK